MEVLDVKEFGSLLGVKRQQANNIVRELGLGIRAGRRVFVPKAAVAELLRPAIERARALAEAER
jgi:hypothetical protein